uniref:Uncharacterized protein n=1 Tax=Romanomermis culicivorax TaxID=13658 RepID=A0A915KV22_ROMCU
MMAKDTLEYSESYVDSQIATAAANRDLTDHEPAALNKLFPCHTVQQKLEFDLNKMTEKTYVSAAQKAKALNMLRHNQDISSLPGDKPTITSELTVNIDTGTAKPNFHPAGATTAADLRVPDILPAEATPTMEVDAEINAVTRLFHEKGVRTSDTGPKSLNYRGMLHQQRRPHAP